MPEQRFSGYRSSSCSHVVVRPCGVCQSVGRGQLLGEDIQDRGFRPDLICGPAIGGVIRVQYVALALKARCVFAERVFDDAGKTERFEIKRGYDEIVRDQSVLIVDDVVNTGFSVRLAYEAVVQSGGHSMGFAAYVNRGNVGAVDLGVENFIF
jgi:orotate phosphoribosyltransferase